MHGYLVYSVYVFWFIIKRFCIFWVLSLLLFVFLPALIFPLFPIYTPALYLAPLALPCSVFSPHLPSISLVSPALLSVFSPVSSPHSPPALFRRSPFFPHLLFSSVSTGFLFGLCCNPLFWFVLYFSVCSNRCAQLRSVFCYSFYTCLGFLQPC